ncbi:hypothetical protein D3C81_1252330 [compost metagenome]
MLLDQLTDTFKLVTVSAAFNGLQSLGGPPENITCGDSDSAVAVIQSQLLHLG